MIHLILLVKIRCQHREPAASIQNGKIVIRLVACVTVQLGLTQRLNTVMGMVFVSLHALNTDVKMQNVNVTKIGRGINAKIQVNINNLYNLFIRLKSRYDYDTQSNMQANKFILQSQKLPMRQHLQHQLKPLLMKQLIFT